MKTKLMMIGALAAACVVQDLAAMPTEEEARRAEPVVKKLLAQERAALNSGKKTRSEVAAAVMGLADKAESEAEKLLLMKGAFTLYVQDGNLEKAAETMRVLETAIADMPPQSVTNMIEMALKGASKKVDGERLYKLLDETRDAEYKFSYKLENRKAIITGINPKPVGTVVIPNNIDGHSVTHIGWEAFRYCKELTSVTIPEGVTHIDGRAFDLCDGLKAVKLPSSLKVVGFAAFGKCAGLTSVTIPNGVKSIAADAFNGSGLKSVVIPESVTSIGDRAFCGCRELGSVTIPAGVASLGKGVFGGCNALKLINIDSGNQAYTLVDGALYTKDRSELVMWPNPRNAVVIPDGVTKIRGWAFAGGSGMTSVTIPESVTTIDDIVFIGCAGLKSVTIPSRVKSIGEHVFERCVELTEVTMLGERPDAPETLFPGCGKLKAIHVPANAKSWAGMKDWFGIPLVFDADDDGRQTQAEGVRGRLLNLRKRLGNVRAERAVEQLQATVDGYTWSYRVYNGEAIIEAEKDGKYSCAVSPAPKGDIVIPATLGGVKVTSIGRSAFLRCGELTSVTIPEGVTIIGNNAFAYCAGLKSATIPSSVRNIDGGAFANCGNLQSIVIPEGVESIKNGAFSWFCGVETVSIPSTVTNIEQGAFCDCIKLRSFHVDPVNPCYRPINGLLCSKDGSYLVAGVNGDVMIPEGVTTIGRDSFHGCQGLNTVLIPSSVTNIEHWAFSFLAGLTSVRVDAANPAYKSVDGLLLTKDGRKLVRGVNGKVTIPDGVECIIDAAFSCSRVDSLAIPEGVTNIEHAAFYRCSGIQTVTIPSSVKNIGGGAFGRCYDLTSVTMRGERPEAPNDIFMGCGKLKSIHVPANAKSWEGMKDWLGIPLVFDAN